ncbi:regulatory helix-turn-helix AraC family protein, partial [Pedobacter alluvionis]
VSGIAYSLGFNYPHYFNRLFKSKTGMTPQEYRKLN